MKTLTLILLTSLIICTGCGSKELEEVDSPNNPKTNIMELNLKNKEKIRLWCRTIFSFEAGADGVYSIESQNPSIAKVSVEGKKFTIRTLSPGETNIIIKNTSGGKFIMKCVSCTFANVWSESYELENLLRYKNSVTVVADDKIIAEKIQEELKPISLNRGYEYDFTEKTNQLSVLLPAQGDPIKGTYTWDVQTQTLTLSYKGQTERYTCDIQPEFPNFYEHQPRFIMAIKQNLTEKYISQYPNAGIKDVYIIRHIIALGDYWLTEKKQTN